MFNELCLIVILSSLIGRWVFQPFGWIIWVVSGLLWIISSFQGCCSSFPEFIFLTIQSQSAVLKLLSSNSRPHFDWFPYRFADDDCYFADLWVVVGSVNSIREEFCFCSTIPSIRYWEPQSVEIEDTNAYCDRWWREIHSSKPSRNWQNPNKSTILPYFAATIIGGVSTLFLTLIAAITWTSRTTCSSKWIEHQHHNYTTLFRYFYV